MTGGPPPDLDWDMWLGPAPKMPYEEVWTVGRRGYWDFWGGMATEWGSHLVDIVLWAMKVQGPISTVAAGGRFFRPWSQIPDTLEVMHEYPTFLFQHSILNHNTFGLNGDPGAARFGSYGIQHGAKGTLFADRSGFRITPQTVRREESNQPPPPPTTDSREPGFYYTGDPPGRIGQFGAALAARPQLPGLRQESSEAGCRYRGWSLRQHRLPARQYCVSGRPATPVGFG
ncbi:MAG: hypothetical protein EHM23_36220 [Acidobacteria bacterium]|nr:MAG: hypothetical protein EHM23_36220 [Acidobacteriota bacterium]